MIRLQPVILDRYCQSIISEIDRIGKQAEISNHDKYLEIFRLMKKHDREIALLFDNTRRSNAIEQLVVLKSRGLIENEDLYLLTPIGERRNFTGLTGCYKIYRIIFWGG